MSTTYITTLIQKYASSGILVDSNLLLLYLIGQYDRERIDQFKVTQDFTIDDFDLLHQLLSNFHFIIATPNILTEVSNLSGKLDKRLLPQFRTLFAERIKLIDERSVPSKEVCDLDSFLRYGLADAVTEVVGREHCLVLTHDLSLYAYLVSAGVDAINFNHIRPLGWK